jgi:hypothetical protein
MQAKYAGLRAGSSIYIDKLIRKHSTKPSKSSPSSYFLLYRVLSTPYREVLRINRKCLTRSKEPIYLCFIKQNNTDKMKTTITILAAVLTLNAGILFAGNDNISTAINDATATFTLASLAPVAPAEATFEDFDAVDIDFSILAPAVPIEADFSDIVPVASIDILNLAPVAPIEVDFEEIVAGTIDISAVAPTTPAVADFE